MPIYEFICPDCKTLFELRCSFSQSDQPARCPKCNSPGQRVISSFACKMGSNIQPAEKTFRQIQVTQVETTTPVVLITPPPRKTELLPPPAKKKSRGRPRKK
jgi:putative FmdB family regulatory protein